MKRLLCCITVYIKLQVQSLITIGGGEDAQYPLAKELDKKLIQTMWGKIVEEVKERKICLETHTITIKLGN
jgi:hypothetical protein